MARDEGLGEAAEAAWEALKPYLTLLGTSGVAGVVAGVVLRRIGQAFAVALALLAVGLRAMEHVGFVTVHWDRIETATASALDANRDGAVNMDDARRMLQGVAFLTAGIPSIGSFLAGLLLGVRL